MRWGKMPICNGMPERAPQIGGKCFLLCWRCFMSTFSLVSVSVLLKIVKLPFIMNTAVTFWAIFLIIPIGVDGIRQYVFGKISTNFRRGVTGGLFGTGVAILAFQVVNKFML